LSGGQQQRVALIRALGNEPHFLIADEPTANVDVQTGSKMIELLLKLRKEKNMGIILSTHDTAVASCMDAIYELRKGQLVHKKIG
jgi:putative ABC transport system ATP-binding protein